MSDQAKNINPNDCCFGNSNKNTDNITNGLRNLENDKMADHLSEIMNLNLGDYSNQNSKRFSTNGSSIEINENFSCNSKSSTNEYCSPGSYKLSSATNYLLKDMNNNPISIESDNESDKHITKLFVGNLPTSTTLPELLAVFKKFGPVNEALSVVKDHNYAFIHFYNRKDAEVALHEVNDSLFKDRYIRVQFSTSQGFTNTKNKNLDKRRSMISSKSLMSISDKQYVYPNSAPFSSSASFFSANNSFLASNKSSRPITGSRLPHSHTTTFYDKNFTSTGSCLPHSHTTNFYDKNLAMTETCLPHSTTNTFFDKNLTKHQVFNNTQPQSNLLIEASKLQNIKLNPYSQYNEEIQQRQQLIQALYLRQQQQLLQQQVQQQLQKK